MEPPIFPPDPNDPGGIGGDPEGPPSLTFPALIDQISTIRESLRSERMALAVAREAIEIANRNLAFAIQNGLDTQDFLDTISTQTTTSSALTSAIDALLVDETYYVNELNTNYTAHQSAVSQLRSCLS